MSQSRDPSSDQPMPGAGARVQPSMRAYPASPPRLRLASWNIEWMNALFDDRGQFINSSEPSARHGITKRAQTEAIGIVLSALDADGIMIIEGPDTTPRRSTVKALETMARVFGLRASRAVHGFSSDTEQEIAFLHDPTRLRVVHDPKGAGPARDPLPGAAPVAPQPREAFPSPRFDLSWRDPAGALATRQPISFSKPPLELEVITSDPLRLGHGNTTARLRLIGVHAKSKNPHGATDAASAMRISVDNRRKQLAQCAWIRQRVIEHMAAGDELIVMGDFNDGPGLDEFETQFGQSGVEVAMGCADPPAQRLFDPNAMMALNARLGASPTTSRFWLREQNRHFEALLDFIMVTPGLRHGQPDWRIWHPFNDPGVMAVPELREAILDASDHFPVTLDLALALSAAPADRTTRA